MQKDEQLRSHLADKHQPSAEQNKDAEIKDLEVEMGSKVRNTCRRRKACEDRRRSTVLTVGTIDIDSETDRINAIFDNQ